MKNIYFYLSLLFIVSISSESVKGQGVLTEIDSYSGIENCQLDKKEDYHTSVRLSIFEETKFDTLDFLKNSFKYYIFNEDAYNVSNDKYSVRINPLIKSSALFDVSDKNILSDFRAGLQLKAKYKDKIKFQSNIFYAKTALIKFNANFANSTGIIPHYGRFISKDNNNYSFISGSSALIFSPAEYISFEGGVGRNFFGNGYRSLFLSNNSGIYPYFKTTVDIWKVKYAWLISRLRDNNLVGISQKDDMYGKFTFTHYLSLNLSKRINFNFFETVITNSYDQKGRKGIELSYFNPVIFYRSVEFATGTYDNSLMGIGLNIRLWKKAFLYSQFILDDMIVGELTSGKGWWANKIGLQAGIKAHDFLNVKNLFFLGEINAVRPYTYSHGRDNINYGNMYQPLAHPLGANFAEAVSIIKYTYKRLSVKSKIIISQYGADFGNDSYGNNIYKNYMFRPDLDNDNKPDNYGITFLQGDKTNYYYFDLNFSYLVNPKSGMLIEAGFISRKKQNSQINQSNNYLYLGISSRIFNDNIEY